MKHLAFILILFNLNLANGQLLTPLQKSQRAEKELKGLHFFYDNKGMILPPSFLPFSLKKPIGKVAIGIIKKKLESKFGLNISGNEIIGYHEVLTPNKNRVGVVGCAMCHSGKAAGRTIIGLGNKNIDIYSLAMTAKGFLKDFESIDSAKPWFSKKQRDERRELGIASSHFMNQIGDRSLSAKTQGLIPIGLVRRWFYQIQNAEIDTTEPGQVKIPSFWGYGEKRKVGSFSDGFGNGVQPGWAVAVELVAGQTPDNVRKYIDKIHHAEDVLADLLPPAYPFEIDQRKANRGQELFNKTCAKCHGQYSRDFEGTPNYIMPKLIPWKVVKTDVARILGVTDFFRELVASNPLSDILNATENEPGYIAPRLHGIWARFPYLHNGSVPSVYYLLKPEAQRPKYFSLRDAGELSRFNKKTLGLNRDTVLSESHMRRLLAQQARFIYDTNRHGHSNQGHSFRFLSDLTDSERFEIIEYLKTL